MFTFNKVIKLVDLLSLLPVFELTESRINIGRAFKDNNLFTYLVLGLSCWYSSISCHLK
jgi:hypothetical protein